MLAGGYLDDPDSNVVFYILLKAVDRFYTQYHRYPGTEIISGIYQCGLLNSEFEISFRAASTDSYPVAIYLFSKREWLGTSEARGE